MGFVDTFLQIASYLGIVLLGIGMLIALLGIIPALSWLFRAASELTGPFIFRRLLLGIAVFSLSYAYLEAPLFYGVAAWWKAALAAGIVIGVAMPMLRADKVPAGRRRHGGLGMLAALWWALLVFSEALLVSDAPHQAAVLYLFGMASGLLAGGSLGTMAAQIARRRMTASAGDARA